MPRKRQEPAQAPAAPQPRSTPAEKAAATAAKKEVKRLAALNNKARNASKRVQSPLSQCTRRYLYALADPFAEASVGACIPINPSFPSQKLSLFFRGVGKTGTNSLGWIWGNPTTMMANDGVAVIFTDDTTGGAYAGTTLVSAVTAGVDTTSGKSNSPYTQAQIDGKLVAMRLVAAGIRMMYTGSELNKGGTMIAIEEPTHQSVSGLSYSQIRTYRDIVEYTAGRHHIGVTYTPIRESEIVYSTFAARVPANGFMALMFKSAVAEQPFAFEVFAHFEAVGSLTAYSATANSVDPTGYAAAQQVIQNTDASTGVIADDGALAKVGRAFASAAEAALDGFSAVGRRAAWAGGATAATVATHALSTRLGRHPAYRGVAGAEATTAM